MAAASTTAIGVLETRGMVALVGATDAMLKTADVHVCGGQAIGSGWVTILVQGAVSAVQAAMGAGVDEAKRHGEVITEEVIPQADLRAMEPMPHGRALDAANDGDYRALGILETRGLTPLIQGGDAMVKAAPVEIAGWTFIGGALVHLAVRGDVASVEAAVAAGRAAAELAGEVCASLVIPFPAKGVGPLVPGGGAPAGGAPPALGILETTGYVAAVGGSDAMVKAAPVEILRLTIASGGRVVALVTGNVDSVTTAVEAGTVAAREAGEWNGSRVISGPSPQVMACFGETGGERNRTGAASRGAMGLIETRSTIALVKAVDLMLKTADVEFEGRHKVGYFLTASVVRGDVGSVRTAVAVGAAEVEKWGELVSAHVIPHPFEEMESRLVHR